jgi:hypothetical protein
MPFLCPEKEEVHTLLVFLPPCYTSANRRKRRKKKQRKI